MLLYKMKSSKPLYAVRLPLAKHKHYGIYGGSFNPVHLGHKAVTEYALQALDIHQLIVLVTPQNPFKDPSIYAPFDVRFKQTFDKIYNPKCLISDFEKTVQSHNTFETLAFFRKKYPTNTFTYIIGSDSLSHLHRWHFFKIFAKHINFAIIVRPTQRFSIRGLPAMRFIDKQSIKCDILLRPFHFISSTALRKQEHREFLE
jgi:nicotinate-nucleotide adenylyltransferase